VFHDFHIGLLLISRCHGADPDVWRPTRRSTLPSAEDLRQDRYLPRQLHTRGEGWRLSMASVLAFAAIEFVVAFRAEVTR